MNTIDQILESLHGLNKLAAKISTEYETNANDSEKPLLLEDIATLKSIKIRLSTLHVINTRFGRKENV